MSNSPEGHEPTDEKLAERAQAGCGRSFEDLMRRYQPGLLQFLRMRSDADAEDLLQETFLRAFRGLASYRRGKPLRPWLFAIARRASIDAARRRVLPNHAESLESVASSESQPHDLLARKEDGMRLWSLARAVLSEREWSALWMHYAEGMPTDEIAAVLGRSRPAIKTMLCRARKELAMHLSPAERDAAVSLAGQDIRMMRSAYRGTDR